MDHHPENEAKLEHPVAAQKANVFDEEAWDELKCHTIPEPPLLGFLQMCADRRFHRCIQERFQLDAGLGTPEDYWIHADAGGTPRMADQTLAPNYCYFDKKVRKMGWSAHGDKCGGWPGVPDDEIRKKLIETMRKKVLDYPLARHFIYFATTKTEKGAEELVLYCLTYDTASDQAE